MIPEIRIENFDYDLPDGRIAKYPLEERDASKLLVRKGNNIIDALFSDIPSFLPEGALMIFNDTKVVPARLFFILFLSLPIIISVINMIKLIGE